MSLQPNREEAIVEAALALPPEERGAYLDQACADDSNLRQLVEALLHAHKQLGVLRHQETATGPKPTMVVSLPPTEKPGDRIDRYKLLQQIGEGGCGVVYMAEQEEPVRRRVALKVIKLGMDTKQVIARFEAERQALALMDHPNIAKVLDGGATDTGRPYFVMELVKGIPITRYCDENKLDTRQRLDLFIQVCQAVQHAHQKGIIHRDIKPSNILIADHDGVPVPKVIDFGIAKATAGQPLTDKTLFTALEQFIGTPAYMSPEQAKLSGLDIDTRSDIYSLGVLLYELLTGKTPFDAKRLIQAGLEEICRIIREEEPPRPSTKLSTLDAGEQSTVANQRQLEPPKLVGLIRGDLDWIVMKCLEKDRARRYETSNGLARDIERHLNNETVAARPPSNLYRLQKLVRRNRLAFTAGGAVAAALVVGLVVSTWLFIKERASRQRAVAAERTATTEAKKSQQVARFLEEMLAGVGPSVALGRDTKLLREILDKTAGRVNKGLSGQPEVEAELLSTLGGVYRHLGEYDRAETLFTNALVIRKRLFGEQHRLVADSLNSLALVFCQQGKLVASESMHREVLAMRKNLMGEESADVAASLNNLGWVLLEEGKFADAETVQYEALVMKKKVFGPENPDVATSLCNLALVFQQEGRLAESESMHYEALAMRKKLFGEVHPDVAASLNNLGLALWAQGRFAEAETVQRKALEMKRNLLSDEHPDVATSLSNVAILLMEQGKLVEAESMHCEALAMRKRLLGKEHADVATSLNNLALVLQQQGSLVEAETSQCEALLMQTKLLGVEHPDVATSIANLANLLKDQERLVEAEALHREALRMREKLLGAAHPDVASSFEDLARLLIEQGRVFEAEPLAERCAAILQNQSPAGWRLFYASSLIGCALLGQKKYTEAEPFLLSGYRGMKQREDKIPVPMKQRLREAVERIVELYAAWGKPEKAGEWKSKLPEP